MPQRLDPLTHQARADGWQRTQKKVELVAGKKIRGFNLRYWQRIVRVPAKIDEMARRRGTPAFRAMQDKAMMTARMLAYYVDHIAQGEIVSAETAKRLGMKGIEPLTEDEKHEHWLHEFDSAIYRYRSDPKMLPFDAIKSFDQTKAYEATADQMAERDTITHLMRHIPDLITPPRKVLARRIVAFKRHQGAMERAIQQELLLGEQERHKLFLGEVDHVLEENVSDVEKANKICFAAGVYADAEERTPGRKEKQTWDLYYANAMFMVFDRLKNQHDQVIDAIEKLK